MFDFIIKLLGGFTSHEYSLQQTSLDAWRQRATAAETTVELVKEIMTRERDRADKLTERLTGPADKLRADYSQVRPPEMNPVGNSVSSWPRIKRELERQNRVNAEISREKIESEIRSG